MDPAALRGELAAAIEAQDPIGVETLNMACFWISRELEGLEFTSAEAGVLARCLLRAAGRVLIDTAGPHADPGTWAGTHETVLVWLDEVLRALGYGIQPLPEGGRPPLPEAGADWH
ncbi:MAG: hypothetical protein ACREPI_12875 [Candidatus Dormibacterales bacterium]